MSNASRALCLAIGVVALVALAPSARAFDAKAFRFERPAPGAVQPEDVQGPGGARSIQIQFNVFGAAAAGTESTPGQVGTGETLPLLTSTVIQNPPGCGEPKLYVTEGKDIFNCDWTNECLNPGDAVELCFTTPYGPIQIISAVFLDGVGETIGPAVVTQLPSTPCGPIDCSGAVGSVDWVWPPNHDLTPVTISGVTGQGDVNIVATGVTSDEAVNARGDGNTCPDAAILDGTAWVRMERSGRGNGRVYRISFTATDEAGASCNGSVTVCVPHDKHHSECVDDGQNYDALAECPSNLAAPDAAPGLVVQAQPRVTDRATLDFTVPRAGLVTITLLDVAGRRVATLDQGERAAGTHRFTWDTHGIPSGVYFYRVRTLDDAASRPVVIAH